MRHIREAIGDIRAGNTWTERIHYASPLLLALLKSLPILSARAHNQAAAANARMSAQVAAINHRAIATLGMTDDAYVMGGPFRGMRYLRESTGSVVGPKLAGLYESEIAGWIEQAARHGYARAIDVGSAEGYYAVGLAYADPAADVHAFDLDQSSRSKVAELARLNGVGSRVQVGCLCDHATLRALLALPGRSLLIVDIEGAEGDLLDPVAVPELRYADIIVELHEHARPGVSWRLLNRFVYSHRVDVASALADEIKIADAVRNGFPAEQAALVAPESRRLPQLWLRLSAFAEPTGPIRAG